MALGALWTCDSCRRRVRGTKNRTMLGRTICTSCLHTQDAAVLGVLTGTGPSDQIARAVAIGGVRSWVRRALGKAD